MQMIELRVDEEFRALIPPLSPEERAGLEADLVEAQGATLPLVVWDATILDGHNRYEICTRHGLRYGTIDPPAWVKSRSDAVVWICKTSLNRRNLGLCARVVLTERVRAEIEAQAAVRVGGRPERGVKPSKNFGQVSDPHDQRSETKLAKMAGVSAPTYKAAKAVVDNGVPELVAALNRRDISASLAAEVASLPAEQQEEIAGAPNGRAIRRLAIKALRPETLRHPKSWEQIGEEFKECKARGLTDEQAAEEIGCSLKHVYDVKKGLGIHAERGRRAGLASPFDWLRKYCDEIAIHFAMHREDAHAKAELATDEQKAEICGEIRRATASMNAYRREIR